MRFVYDFYNWCWMNLRLSIRRLGIDSIWYKTLYALLSIFGSYTEKANWIYYQIWLETASENGLDLWGRRYGVTRLNGESDADYRIRITQKKAIHTSGTTIAAKRVYIASILGVDVSEITITNNINLPSMAMGGIMGSFVTSRNYAIYGYIINIPFLITDDTKRQRMVDLINETNVGGNYPVFYELVGNYEPAFMGSVMGSVVRSRYGNLDDGIYDIY